MFCIPHSYCTVSRSLRYDGYGNGAHHAQHRSGVILTVCRKKTSGREYSRVHRFMVLPTSAPTEHGALDGPTILLGHASVLGNANAGHLVATAETPARSSCGRTSPQFYNLVNYWFTSRWVCSLCRTARKVACLCQWGCGPSRRPQTPGPALLLPRRSRQ